MWPKRWEDWRAEVRPYHWLLGWIAAFLVALVVVAVLT